MAIKRFLSRIKGNIEPQNTFEVSESPSLRINQLSVNYGQYQALKGASLEAFSNEILALVGPSGCGKSSLLASINRMTENIKGCQVEGEILLDGENVLSPAYRVDKLRKKVGMVFQQPNPFPLSIRENICFPLKDHGMKSARDREHQLEKVLRQTGLWEETKDRLNTNALRLSGGQQQRLCIARALALEPSVLLLDEPCSALDPISTEKIEDLIQELKTSITMIMVTHNLSQARRIADQVAVCWVENNSGYVVECNHTEAIFDQSSHPITQAYCMGRAG